MKDRQYNTLKWYHRKRHVKWVSNACFDVPHRTSRSTCDSKGHSKIYHYIKHKNNAETCFHDSYRWYSLLYDIVVTYRSYQRTVIEVTVRLTYLTCQTITEWMRYTSWTNNHWIKWTHCQSFNHFNSITRLQQIQSYVALSDSLIKQIHVSVCQLQSYRWIHGVCALFEKILSRCKMRFLYSIFRGLIVHDSVHSFSNWFVIVLCCSFTLSLHSTTILFLRSSIVHLVQ